MADLAHWSKAMEFCSVGLWSAALDSAKEVHPSFPNIHPLLVYILCSLGRLVEASTHMQCALKSCKNFDDEIEVEQAHAFFLCASGQYKKAKDVCSDALGIQRKKGKWASIRTATLLTMAAHILRRLDEPQPALTLLLQVLEIHFQMGDFSSKAIAFVMDACAGACLEMHFVLEGHAFAVRAIELYASAQKDDTHVLGMRTTLAIANYILGFVDEAHQSLQTIWSERVRLLGENHLDTANARLWLALMVDSDVEAQEHRNVARRVYEMRLGKSHPLTKKLFPASN